MVAALGIVRLVSAVLIVGGIGLLVLTIWFWRTSRPEPTALAPLEIMSERAFRKSKGVDRQFLLHQVRPAKLAEQSVEKFSRRGQKRTDEVDAN
jgi:hypothetical protein